MNSNEQQKAHKKRLLEIEKIEDKKQIAEIVHREKMQQQLEEQVRDQQ